MCCIQQGRGHNLERASPGDEWSKYEIPLCMYNEKF